MEVSKIIYGRVGPRGTYTEGMITEEDYGILFKMPDLDLPAAYQVDFSNKLTGGTALTVVGNEDGALIPTSLIDSGKDVYAFMYYTGVGFGKTTHVFRIPNKRRAKRTIEAPTDEQQSAIDQAINALNEAVDKVNNAESSAEQSASDSEAWAVGQRGGVDVSKTDETYRNNSKHYAELAQQALAESGYITGFLNELGQLIIEVVGITGIDVRVEDSEVVVVYE